MAYTSYISTDYLVQFSNRQSNVFKILNFEKDDLANANANAKINAATTRGQVRRSND